VDRALPLVRIRRSRSVLGELPATVAVLTGDPAAMQPALALAPNSDPLALNAGRWPSARQDAAGARAAYARALDLRPAALLRCIGSRLTSGPASARLAGRPAGQYLGAGAGRGGAGSAQLLEAIGWFEQARAEAPEQPALRGPGAGVLVGRGQGTRQEQRWQLV
jgi:hypothetical protein